MEKKKSSFGSRLASKEKSKAVEKEKLLSRCVTPVANKSASLYKSVLKESVEKLVSHSSKQRQSLGRRTSKSPKECGDNKNFDFHCSFDSDEESKLDCSIPCTLPATQDKILQGIVAYVEARSNTENRFEGISKQMELLGAKVVKKFIPEVTHVVFKDGKKATREKALKHGIHLVNVLWVESCRQSGKHVAEELFPVLIPDEAHTPIITGRLKRTKSMQPTAFEEDVRNSAEKVDRRRRRKAASETTSTMSPLITKILCQDTQTTYSPAPIRSSLSTELDFPGRLNTDDCTMKEDIDAIRLNERLNFDEPSIPPTSASRSTSSKRTKQLLQTTTPVTQSPRTIVTDILQTASGPGKKRKRIKPSIKDVTSSESEENLRDKKKNKQTELRPVNEPDVFAFDEEELPQLKISRVKKNVLSKSMSTVGNTVENSSSVVQPDQLIDKLADVSPKKKRPKTLQTPKRPSGRAEKDFGRDAEQDARREAEWDAERDTVGVVSLSDSGVYLSEVETRTKAKDTEPLKRNLEKKRKYNKTERLVAEVSSAEDEIENRDLKAKSSKRTKSLPQRKRKEGVKKVAKKVESEEDELPGDLSTGSGSDVEEARQITNTSNGNRKFGKGERIDSGGEDCESDDDHDNGCLEDSDTHKSKANKYVEKKKSKEKYSKIKKPSRSLVFTSMHFGEQDVSISIVRKLGGFYIADNVDDNTTHVISGNPRRTLNVLMAIAQGYWLVSPEWVMKSLEAGYWIDEEPYELSDAFPSAQLSRLERINCAAEYHQELFSDIDPIFVCGNTSPPSDSLIKLVTLCGGTICTSIRKAGVCIGNSNRQTKAINVSEAWVMDSITEHVALPFNSYKLHTKKPSSPTF